MKKDLTPIEVCIGREVMKMVEAIIRPERFEDVKYALEKEGHFPMTCSEVRGRGEQRGIILENRGKNIQVDTLPKMRIELVIQDEDLNRILTIIQKAARTGRKGDGKIFIFSIDRMIRIRTGEEWN
jgi:nitrogen regulatory protein P-II 1